MFVGHWAPALVASTHPRAPKLATLFVAAQLVDWAFFAFLLVGVEHMRFTPGITVMNPMDLYDMPFTHSLAGSLGFAAAFGALVYAVLRDGRAAMIAAAVVLSHWMLDLLVHRPDLTLAGHAPKLGFGLWNHPAIEMPLEIGITLAALWFYGSRTGASRLRLGVLGAVMTVLQAINWFGPVDPEVTTATTLLAFFAYAIATLAAWWVGKSVSTTPRAG